MSLLSDFHAKHPFFLHLALILFGLGHLASLVARRSDGNTPLREVNPSEYLLRQYRFMFISHLVWPDNVTATFPTSPPPLIDVDLSIADVPTWNEALPHEFAQVYLGKPPLPYVASMFHTLHCTRMLLDSLNGTMPTVGTLRALHLTHCVNYVRQMTLCQADATLEEVAHSGNRHGTPGNRKCRDWGKVLRSTEEHYGRDVAKGLFLSREIHKARR